MKIQRVIVYQHEEGWPAKGPGKGIHEELWTEVIDGRELLARLPGHVSDSLILAELRRNNKEDAAIRHYEESVNERIQAVHRQNYFMGKEENRMEAIAAFLPRV